MEEIEKRILEHSDTYVKYVVDPYRNDMHFSAGDEVNVEMLYTSLAAIAQVTYMALLSVQESGHDAKIYRLAVQKCFSENEFWDEVMTIQEEEQIEKLKKAQHAVDHA